MKKYLFPILFLLSSIVFGQSPIHLSPFSLLGSQTVATKFNKGVEVTETLIGNDKVAFPMIGTSSDTNSFKPVGDSAGYLRVLPYWPGSSSGGGGVLVKTVAQMQTLRNSKLIVKGTYYNITDADAGLYGGTNIIVMGTSDTTLAQGGTGLFYNPKYVNGTTGYGIWNPYAKFTASSLSGKFTAGENVTANNGAVGTLLVSVSSTGPTYVLPVSGSFTGAISITGNTSGRTANIASITVPAYSAGNIVIWGGRAWSNVAGAVGTATDIYTLSAAWAVLAYDRNNYNIVSNDIEYNFAYDKIIARKDWSDNEVKTNYWSNYDNGTNAIKAFQWGNDLDTNSYKGLGANHVIDSYFETVNFTGSTIRQVNLSQGSTASGNTFLNTSYMQQVTLTNNCSFSSNVNATNSGFYEITMMNGSSVVNNKLGGNNSRIQNVTMNNNSSINSNVINNGSNFTLFDLDKATTVSNNNLNNTSFLRNIQGSVASVSLNILSNTNNINHIYADNGNVISNVLDNSANIDYGWLTTGSSITGNQMDASSTINYVTLENVSRIFQDTLNAGTIFRYGTMDRAANVQNATYSGANLISFNLHGSNDINRVFRGLSGINVVMDDCIDNGNSKPLVVNNSVCKEVTISNKGTTGTETISNSILKQCTVDFAGFTGCTLDSVNAQGRTFTFTGNNQKISNQAWLNEKRLDSLIAGTGIAIARGSNGIYTITSSGAPPTGPAGGDLAGTYPNPTVKQASNAFAFKGVLDMTGTPISGTVNNYSPAGIANAAILMVDATSATTLTGIASGGAPSDGRFFILYSTPASGGEITMKHDATFGSSPQNCFWFSEGRDYVLKPGGAVAFWYNGSGGRWHCITDFQRPESNNLTAASNPTINDDNGSGYLVGSLWFNASNNSFWICQNNASGGAVWKVVSNTTTHAVDPTSSDDEISNYYVGSLWLNTVSNAFFYCSDATSGAAVWLAVGNSTNIYNSDGVQSNLTRTYDGNQGALNFNNLSFYTVQSDSIDAVAVKAARFGSAAQTTQILSNDSLYINDGNSPGGYTIPTISGSVGQVLTVTSANSVKFATPSSPGTGTVTNVSSGNFSPFGTVSVANPTTTPSFTFTASNVAGYKVLWNNTSGSAAPAYNFLDSNAFGGNWFHYVMGTILANSPTYLRTDGSTVGATSVIQEFTNGVSVVGLRNDVVKTSVGLDATSLTLTDFLYQRTLYEIRSADPTTNSITFYTPIVNGVEVTLTAGIAIPNLTLVPSGSDIFNTTKLSLNAGESVTFQYELSTTTWYMKYCSAGISQQGFPFGDGLGGISYVYSHSGGFVIANGTIDNSTYLSTATTFATGGGGPVTISGTYGTLTTSIVGGGVSLSNIASQAGYTFLANSNSGSAAPSAVATAGASYFNWIATPGSSQLATLTTDETGSGTLVFNTSPAFSGTPTFNTGFTGTTFGASAQLNFIPSTTSQTFRLTNAGGNQTPFIFAGSSASSGDMMAMDANNDFTINRGNGTRMITRARFYISSSSNNAATENGCLLIDIPKNGVQRNIFKLDSAAALTIGLSGTATGTLNLPGATSGTISIAGQAAAGTYNFNLPITAGNSGDYLTSGGGSSTAMTWTTPLTTGAANPTGTIGSTAVNGSATTYMRSDAAPKWDTTYSWQIAKSGIATTATLGLKLANTTASTSGATVQYSPYLSLVGHAWRTNATAADSTLEWRIQNIPISSGTPSSRLDFNHLAGASATPTSPFTLTSGGQATFLSGVQSSGVVSASSAVVAGVAVSGSIGVRFSNAGGSVSPYIAASANSATAGVHSDFIGPNTLNNDIILAIGNGTNITARGIIKDTTTSNSPGSENGTILIQTPKNGGAPTTKLIVDSISCQLLGTDGSNSAVAGYVGESFESYVSTYTNYTTTATYQNIASIALTSGDWEIDAQGTFSSNGATITGASDALFVISTTTASAAGATEGKNIIYLPQAALLGTSHESIAIAPYRVLITSNTTYFLNTQATFTIGNPQFVGGIHARRIR